METRLAVLRLVMNQLEVDSNIDTIDERISFQKAVYLAQAAGVALGYKYNWYVRGPYSPDLTKDYYALHEHLEESSEGDPSGPGLRLKEPVVEKLRNILPALRVPSDLTLSQTEWLESLASVHYLMAHVQLDAENTTKRLEELKPTLSPYTGKAIDGLINGRLLSSG